MLEELYLYVIMIQKLKNQNNRLKNVKDVKNIIMQITTVDSMQFAELNDKK